MCNGLPGKVSSRSYSTTSCVFAPTCPARYCDSGMRVTFPNLCKSPSRRLHPGNSKSDRKPAGVLSYKMLYYVRNSPGKGLRRFASRPRPHLVQLLHIRLAEFYLQRAQAFRQLVHLARTDDRRSHNGICQQPGEGHISGYFFHFLAKILKLTYLGCVFFHFFCNALFTASSCLLLAARTCQQPTCQRAPRD